MKREFSVELFRFNAQTDYLPYYQKHTIKCSLEETVNELLHRIHEKENFGFKDNGNVRINDVFVNAKEKLSRIVERCGYELTLRPVSEFRAQQDLLIDNSDFLEKLEVMADYIDAAAYVAYRQSSELVYYASNTLNYNRKYIGDHVLLIAADILEERFELRHEILQQLIDDETGVWFHTSLKNRLLDGSVEKKIEKIVYLAQRMLVPQGKLAKKLALIKPIMRVMDFESEPIVDVSHVQQGFDGFNIAAYHGVNESRLKTLIEDSGARYIDIAGAYDDLGATALLVENSFSYQIAGDILLAAKDAGADFMVVKNETTKTFFDQNQKKIQKHMGRAIDLSVISLEQFGKLLSGEKNPTALGFDQHAVRVDFL